MTVSIVIFPKLGTMYGTYFISEFLQRNKKYNNIQGVPSKNLTLFLVKQEMTSK